MTSFLDYCVYSSLLVVVLTILFYRFCTSTFNYWKDRGVAYVEPIPLFGNIKEQILGTKPVVEIYHEIYNKISGNRFGGFYQFKTPTLMVMDPKLVDAMLVQDFRYFYDRGFPVDIEHNPLSANLFTLEGQMWRKLRYKLTPTFSTGKLKGMFDQIEACGDKLVRYIEEGSRSAAVESKATMIGFTLDVIASCAFGLSLDKDDPLSATLRRIITRVLAPFDKSLVKQIVFVVSTKLANILNIKPISKDIEDIMTNLVKGSIKYRQENRVDRNDFLQLMLNLRKQEEMPKSQPADSAAEEVHPDDDIVNQLKHAEVGIEDDKHEALMTDAVIVANTFVFLVAGADTVSSTVTFALLCLSKASKLQDRVHQEIKAAIGHHNGQWTYQSVKEMVYLDQVIQETLRLYPITFQLFRVCTEPYQIPDSKVVIEKGTRITVPIYSIHRDPRYYPAPEEFDPDRFVDNNFKPSGHYLPFGNGPRNCIGMRFAILEVKIVLAKILFEFSVNLNNKTQLPLKYMNSTTTMLTEQGIWFDFEKRANS